MEWSKEINLWYLRYFKVITNEKAKQLNLIHVENVHGDRINHLNCRSIWKDKKDRFYRVEHLN